MRSKPLFSSVVIKNTIYLYFIQGFNYIFPVILVPYLTRTLGIASYGLMNMVVSYASFFSILIDFGFNFNATKHVAANIERKNDLENIISSVYKIKFLLLLLSALIYFVLVFCIPSLRDCSLAYVFAFPVVLGAFLTPFWLYQGMQKMIYITTMTGVSKLISLIFTFIFVHPGDTYIAILIYSITSFALGAALALVALIVFKLNLKKDEPITTRTLFAESGLIFISNISSMSYTTLAPFLVGSMAGPLQAGLYSACDKIRQIALGFFQPVSKSFFPHIIATYEKDRKQAKKTANIETIILMAVALCGILIIFFARDKLILFLKIANQDSREILLIASISLIPVAISTVKTSQWLIAIGENKKYFLIYLIAGVFGLSSLLLLTHYWGSKGASIAVLLTETIVVAFSFILHGKKQK
jgi:PST family polysaccharide transporter